MAGESDLGILLQRMQPDLSAEVWGYGVIPAGTAAPEGLAPFAVIREDEGLTVIAPVADLTRHGIGHDGDWAKITLRIHSDLAAVGLTAAVAAALTAEGISANVVAGYFHDHVFVQAGRGGDAMAALARLSGRRP